MRVLILNRRRFDAPQDVERALSDLYQRHRGLTLLLAHERGASRTAMYWARRWQVPYQTVSGGDRSPGSQADAIIAQANPDLILAFEVGETGRRVVTRATGRGITVHRYPFPRTEQAA